MKRWLNLGCMSALALTLIFSGCSGADEKKEKLEDSADFHYKIAAGYYHNHQVAWALRELSQALEKDPDHVEAHYLIAVIYMGRRNYNKAVHHFKSCVRLRPSYFEAQNSLGAVYLAMERWDDAIVLFEQLLDQPLYTSPELAHNNMGWALYNKRDHSEALEHFKMAIFLRPEFCLGYNNVGLALDALNNPPEAARYFRKAIDACPNNFAEPHFNLGKLLSESNHNQARAHFQRCLELQPSSSLGERCRQYLQAL